MMIIAWFYANVHHPWVAYRKDSLNWSWQKMEKSRLWRRGWNERRLVEMIEIIGVIEIIDIG